MKKILKTLLLFVLSLCTVIVSFGCGNTGDPADPDAVELRVGYQQDSAEGVITTTLAKAFVEEQAAKGNKVKVTPIGIPAGSYNDTVLRMYNGKNLPDVIYTYDDYASLWAQKGVFENLDSYFTDAGFDFTLYDEKAFDAARVYGDSIYFAPREYNHPVVYVNADMMKEYGIDLSAYRNGWTWDDLLSVSRTLRAKMNEKPIKDYLYPLDSSIEWAPVLNAFVRSNGGFLFAPETGNPGFDQAGTQAAMAEISSLISERLIPDPRSTSSGDAFLNENAAMWITSRPKVSACIDSEISLKFLPVPKMGEEEHYLSYGNTGYAISAISEKKDLAWEFLQFVMSEAGQTTFSKTGNCVPILLSMQNDPDAEWRNYLPGVNQDAFVRSSEMMKEYTYILTTYARGYNQTKERDIYNKVKLLMGELQNMVSEQSAAAFCAYAQEQVNGVK